MDVCGPRGEDGSRGQIIQQRKFFGKNAPRQPQQERPTSRHMVPRPLGLAFLSCFEELDWELCKPEVRAYMEKQVTKIATRETEKNEIVDSNLKLFYDKFINFRANLGKVERFFAPKNNFQGGFNQDRGGDQDRGGGRGRGGDRGGRGGFGGGRGGDRGGRGGFGGDRGGFGGGDRGGRGGFGGDRGGRGGFGGNRGDGGGFRSNHAGGSDRGFERGGFRGKRANPGGPSSGNFKRGRGNWQDSG